MSAPPDGRAGADLLAWDEPPGAGQVAAWELYVGLRSHFSHRQFGVQHADVRRAVAAIDGGEALRAGRRAAVLRFGETLLGAGGDPVDAFFAWLHAQLPEARNLDYWQRYERPLNARLNLALAALSPGVLAGLAAALVPLPAGTEALHAAWLRDADAERSSTGYPDGVLANADVAVLIEMKVRGTGTKDKIEADQVLKYANLVEMLRPRAVRVLVVGPAGEKNLFGKLVQAHPDNPFAPAPAEGEARVPLRLDGAATLARFEQAAAEGRNDAQRALPRQLADARGRGGPLAARLDALEFHRATYGDFVRLLERAQAAGADVPAAAIERFRVIERLAKSST